MTKFLARYRPRIATVLSGFDRLVFRGTLLPLVRPGGMFCFLQWAHVMRFAFAGRAPSGSGPARRSTCDTPGMTRRPHPAPPEGILPPPPPPSFDDHDETGVDVSLLRFMLRMSPLERLEAMERHARDTLSLLEHGRRHREATAPPRR